MSFLTIQVATSLVRPTLLRGAQRWSSTQASASTSATPDTSVHPGASDAITHFRVTLRRSTIGLPAKTDRIVKALGLRKRLSTVYLPKTPDVAGHILSVKELVHVELVRRLDGATVKRKFATLPVVPNGPGRALVPPTMVDNRYATWVNEKDEVVDWGGKLGRKAPRGYKLVGNLVSEVRHQEIQDFKAASQLADDTVIAAAIRLAEESQLEAEDAAAAAVAEIKA